MDNVKPDLVIMTLWFWNEPPVPEVFLPLTKWVPLLYTSICTVDYESVVTNASASLQVTVERSEGGCTKR